MNQRSFFAPFLGLAAFSVFNVSSVMAAPHPDDAAPAKNAAALFPPSAQVSFENLLHAPAGRYGFLRTNSRGRFVWPNGNRARFWGVNVSSRSVVVDKPTIDRVVDTLARSGCNMVRFEAMDTPNGLLPGENGYASGFDADRLDKLDYWIARLRERGIYYYLNLLDFREFSAVEGVDSPEKLGRAARPYAFFDRKLIDLQRKFATEFLSHKNPYTNLAYKDDPALALVEICNEHGLFIKINQIETLAEPYKSSLRAKWNAWLLRRYRTRDALADTWGEGVLDNLEDHANGGVALPFFQPGTPEPTDGYIRGRCAQTRLNDGVRFLYDLQRDYFEEMRTHLRNIGVRVPISAAVTSDVPVDIASAAAELDFTCENVYADHPSFPGQEWAGAMHFRNINPLRESSIYRAAPWMSALRWSGKPVVVREWATVWPNIYRSTAIPEMAAYASLQDVDAVLLFGYQIAVKPDALSDFDHQADPTVWGLFGMGAATYLKGYVQPARHSAVISYSPNRLFTWPAKLPQAHRLAWFVRVENQVVSLPSPRPATARVASIRPSRHASRRGMTRRQISARKPAITTFYPSSGLGLNRMAAQMKASGIPVTPAYVADEILISATKQIKRIVGMGQLKVVTPMSVSISGEFTTGQAMTVGNWRLTSPSPIGAWMAVSLDGRPLATSRKYIVKMVTQAENTNQRSELAGVNAPGKYVLRDWGKAPVLTFGQASTSPMELLHKGKPVLSLALRNGTWELLVNGATATLTCDTPGIRGTLFGKPIRTNDAPVTVRIGRN
jgi:hypothetical protein